VGFLKFLKREKKDQTELDLPPEPPSLEGFEQEHDMDKFPEIPDIKVPQDMDFKDLQLPQEYDSDALSPNMLDMKYDEKAPDFGKMDIEEPEKASPINFNQAIQPADFPKPVQQAPFFGSQQPIKETRIQAAEPVHRPRRLFNHEKRFERPSRKEIFVRVENFKAVLDGIGMIRASVRKSDEALMRLENIKNSKDRSFDRVKSSMEDLQKKLLFIDKTLFKGD